MYGRVDLASTSRRSPPPVSSIGPLKVHRHQPAILGRRSGPAAAPGHVRARAEPSPGPRDRSLTLRCAVSERRDGRSLAESDWPDHRALCGAREFFEFPRPEHERGLRDALGMNAEGRPVGRPEHQDGESTSSKVLLIPKILVRGDQEIKSGRFGLLNQLPVIQLAPAALERGLDDEPVKGPAQRRGRALIEEDLQRASGRNSEAVARVLQHRVNLRTRHAREPLEKLADGRSAFEVLEEGSHGHTRGAEQPFSADLSGHAFYSRAVTPVEHEEKVLQ